MESSYVRLDTRRRRHTPSPRIALDHRGVSELTPCRFTPCESGSSSTVLRLRNCGFPDPRWYVNVQESKLKRQKTKPKLLLIARLFRFCTHARNLAGIDQVPIALCPNDEKIFLILRGRHLFWMLDGKLLSIGKMNIERPERCPIAHLFKIR